MDAMQAINSIELHMQKTLSSSQMKRLDEVLRCCLIDIDWRDNHDSSNDEYLGFFIDAKRLEGCSDRTLVYYRTTIEKFLGTLNSSVCDVTTEQIRNFLSEYQSAGQARQVTVDNVRRILSSFFSWLEVEDFILKSPARRIKKVKQPQQVKAILSEEELESLRDGCTAIRDLAMIDLLRSTGMRVGELVKLNRNSIDFDNMECVVYGKGNKERVAYFDARTKIHLQRYLQERTDSNEALFVGLNAPHRRLQISGVESTVRRLGLRLGIKKVHPHKFRRTLATKAIDKGMPIEQVQVLLGHKKIDTTLRYAMVDQRNVKASHRRFIS